MDNRVIHEPVVFPVEHEFFGTTLFYHTIKYRIRAYFKRVDDLIYKKETMQAAESKKALLLCWYDLIFMRLMKSTKRFFLYRYNHSGNESLEPSCGIYQVINGPDENITVVSDPQSFGFTKELKTQDFRLYGCELIGPVFIKMLPWSRDTLDENWRRMKMAEFTETGSALDKIHLEERAAIAAYREIFERMQEYLEERSWTGSSSSPLTLRTRSAGDGIEISWNWNWRDTGTITLLGFRSDGGFSGKDYEDEGVRIVDSQNPSCSTIDYPQPGKTYYYKFFLKRDFFTSDWTPQPTCEYNGLVKFALRVPPRLNIPDPLVSTVDTYKAVTKVHLAGVDATRARAQFELEKRALEEVLKPEEKSSKDSGTTREDMLRRRQEAMDDRHKLEEWYKAELKRIDDGLTNDIYTQDQAVRLRSELLKLMQGQNPTAPFVRSHH